MPESIELLCSDGAKLKARLYGVVDGSKPIILVAPATAVPQRYYKRFAEYMSKQDFAVLTFDFRDIGESRTIPLNQSKADFLTWGRIDMKAALDWALEHGPTIIVGHSFGGQIFGLQPRINECAALVCFGLGCGWSGYMPFLERFRVWFFWNILGPFLIARNGYMPAQSLGMGEDIPVGVFRQWRAWCQLPHYWFDDPTFPYKNDFAHVEKDIIVYAAADDLWAPPVSAQTFANHYTGARVTFETLNPKMMGVKKIGHMGYFRHELQNQLWQKLAAQLKQFC